MIVGSCECQNTSTYNDISEKLPFTQPKVVFSLWGIEPIKRPCKAQQSDMLYNSTGKQWNSHTLTSNIAWTNNQRKFLVFLDIFNQLLLNPNTDDSSLGNLGVGNIEGVILNNRGDRILGCMKAIPNNTKTLTWLLSSYSKLMPLEISTDSIEAINFIKNDHKSYSSIIRECRLLVQQMGDPKL